MDFVDDDRVGIEAGFAPGRLRKNGAERFGRSQDQMRTAAALAIAILLSGVAGAHLHADLLRGGQGCVHRIERGREVAMDVVIERFERRNVNGADGIRQTVPALARSGKSRKNGKKRGKGFAAAGRREDQRVFARKGMRQSADLNFAQSLDSARETRRRARDASARESRPADRLLERRSYWRDAW